MITMLCEEKAHTIRSTIVHPSLALHLESSTKNTPSKLITARTIFSGAMT